MTTEGLGTNPPDTLGAPVPERSGSTIDEAITTAESGSRVGDGVHTLAGSGPSGDSRIEQLPGVDGVHEGRVDGAPGAATTPPGDGPGPGDIGSGGAQRIVGARISDRVAGGEDVPDGPPFDAAG